MCFTEADEENDQTNAALFHQSKATPDVGWLNAEQMHELFVQRMEALGADCKASDRAVIEDGTMLEHLRRMT